MSTLPDPLKHRRSTSHSSLEKLDEEKATVVVDCKDVLEDDVSEHIDDTVIEKAEDVAVQVGFLLPFCRSRQCIFSYAHIPGHFRTR